VDDELRYHDVWLDAASAAWPHKAKPTVTPPTIVEIERDLRMRLAFQVEASIKLSLSLVVVKRIFARFLMA
jgi:hypothetical protein